MTNTARDVVVEGFDDTSMTTTLQWFAAPDSWTKEKLIGEEGEEEGRGGSWKVDNDNGGLVLYPPSKKDFWRKTYYEPLLVKDDGPFLYAQLDSSDWYTVEAAFDLEAHRQFDQAGIMIRLDQEHWIKTGIEVVDSKPRLSAVVTNCYSDWSTQFWSHYETHAGGVVLTKARIRVHCRGTSFVVEAWMDEKWEFVRICHLSRNMQSIEDPLASHPTIVSARDGPNPSSTDKFWAGVFGACPQEAGARIEFTHFSIIRGSHVEHNAD